MTLHYGIFDLFTTNSLIQEKKYIRARSAKEAVTKYLDGKNINYTLKRGIGDDVNIGDVNIGANPVYIDESGNKFVAIKKRTVWFQAKKRDK